MSEQVFLMVEVDAFWRHNVNTSTNKLCLPCIPHLWQPSQYPRERPTACPQPPPPTPGQSLPEMVTPVAISSSPFIYAPTEQGLSTINYRGGGSNQRKPATQLVECGQQTNQTTHESLTPPSAPTNITWTHYDASSKQPCVCHRMCCNCEHKNKSAVWKCGRLLILWIYYTAETRLDMIRNARAVTRAMITFASRSDRVVPVLANGQTTVNKRAPMHYIIPVNNMVHRPLQKMF